MIRMKENEGPTHNHIKKKRVVREGEFYQRKGVKRQEAERARESTMQDHGGFNSGAKHG